MLGRRNFLALVAAIPALDGIRTRSAKVEKVFDSPGPKPNGLQASTDGLWILDQGNNHVYLVSYENGKVLRDLETESDRGSGLTFDGEAIWIGSTYDRTVIRSDAKTGKTIRKYFTPGAGVIYQRSGDAPARRSPLAQPPPPGRQQQRAAPSAPRGGTGAHGLEWRDGKLWAAVPPSRTIYRIDPERWVVEHQFPTSGNRPHGIGWEGEWLWCTDSNQNAFFKHNVTSGEIVEKIQLADSDPLPHGMTIWKGMMWYCDDVGIVCRLKM
jgi:hypothetical protein